MNSDSNEKGFNIERIDKDIQDDCSVVPIKKCSEYTNGELTGYIVCSYGEDGRPEKVSRYYGDGTLVKEGEYKYSDGGCTEEFILKSMSNEENVMKTYSTLKKFDYPVNVDYEVLHNDKHQILSTFLPKAEDTHHLFDPRDYQEKMYEYIYKNGLSYSCETREYSDGRTEENIVTYEKQDGLLKWTEDGYDYCCYFDNKERLYMIDKYFTYEYVYKEDVIYQKRRFKDGVITGEYTNYEYDDNKIVEEEFVSDKVSLRTTYCYENDKLDKIIAESIDENGNLNAKDEKVMKYNKDGYLVEVAHNPLDKDAPESFGQSYTRDENNNIVKYSLIYFGDTYEYIFEY